MRNASFPLRSPQSVCSPAGSEGTPKGRRKPEPRNTVFCDWLGTTLYLQIPDVIQSLFVFLWSGSDHSSLIFCFIVYTMNHTH